MQRLDGEDRKGKATRNVTRLLRSVVHQTVSQHMQRLPHEYMGGHASTEHTHRSLSITVRA